MELIKIYTSNVFCFGSSQAIAGVVLFLRSINSFLIKWQCLRKDKNNNGNGTNVAN